MKLRSVQRTTVNSVAVKMTRTLFLSFLVCILLIATSSSASPSSTLPSSAVELASSQLAAAEAQEQALQAQLDAAAVEELEKEEKEKEIEEETTRNASQALLKKALADAAEDNKNTNYIPGEIETLPLEQEDEDAAVIAAANDAAASLPAADTPPAELNNLLSSTYENEVHSTLSSAHETQDELDELSTQLGEDIALDCPLPEGTSYDALRKFGHRLWYEGETELARACFKKAITVYLSPVQIVGSEDTKLDDPLLSSSSLFIESSTIPESEFSDFGHVVDMIQRRTERIYSTKDTAIRPELHDRMVKEGVLKA